MKKLSLILLALLAFGPMAWAQTMYPAGNESQLNAAIGYCTTADDYINVTDNITLTSHITIPAGKTITINLGGHTLRRNLSSGTDMGCVIIVAATGNLTISNGTISGGWNSTNDGTHTTGGIVNKGTTTLTNVTISGCKGNDGGGIMNAENATLNITGGTISNCTSNAGGGGIVNKGTATITDCTLSSNTATTRGGAIWSNNSLTVSDCTFNGNTALAIGGDEQNEGDGGAIHLEGGTADLSNVIITNNSSKDAGGIYVKAGATLTMTGTNTISDNTSSEHGGGGLVNYGTTTLSGSTFSGNTAKTSGGAIWNKSSLTVSDCTFGDNEALATGGDEQNEGNGGAIHLEGGTATLTDVTITNNTSKDAGGIYVHSGATLNLGGTTGSTLSGNTSSQHGGGGIVNEGTVNLSGSVSITGNTSHTYGGGIWNNSTLNLQGTIVVTGNTTDNNGTQNLYINQDKVISFTGALASGSNIGLSRTENYNHLAYTSGFSENNTQFTDCDIVSYFTYDLDPTDHVFAQGGGELYRCHTIDGTVATIPYLNDNGMMSQMVGYYKLSEVTDEPEMVLRAGWYAMDQNTITFNNRITVSGEVHFILTDGTILRPKQGICVPRGSTFHIWAQSESTLVGQLSVSNTNMPEDGNMAGIGGNFNEPGGSIHIHGGSMVVYGKGTGAGIGGGGGGGGGGFQSIIISNGGIMARGDQECEVGGAGIGGGAVNVAPDITITGGDVTAYGGYNGAGIGSGCGGLNHIVTDPTTTGPTTTSIIRTIHITGGEVTAYGIGNGAGIGGGGGYVGGYWGEATGLAWDGNSSNIFIDGGTVRAMHYLDDYVSNGQAIGHGHNMPSEQYFPEARIYPGAKVRVKTTIESAAPYTILGKNDRLNALGKDVNSHYKLVIIEPCDHPSATNYTDNNNGTYTTDCAYCTGTNLPHICTHAGNWNDGVSWQSGHVPNGGQDVVLWASATIPSGYTANAANVTLNGSGDGALLTLTIADGGQLLHTNEGVVATVQKSISGYGTSDGGYNLIANPTLNSLSPANLGMTTGSYDLYWFDQSEANEWRNHKSESFNLENGKGYLYANSANTDIAFTGVLNRANADISVPVTYDANADFKGLNLVGNPFVCNAYLLDEDNNIMPFFKMNDTGKALVAAQAGTAIKPCEGVFVICPNDGQTHSVIFTTTAPANLGEAEEVPSMLLPVHALPVHQDASLGNGNIQTTVLSQGANWWSTNLDINFDQLKEAIASALGTTGTATIKSQNGSMSYASGRWRGSIGFDIRQMYKIHVSADCEITLTGVPVNPSEYEVTVSNGSNWIGFLSGESKSVDEAFSGLNPAEGDFIKSKDGSTTYHGTSWRGALQTLVPGQGYIYHSKASGDKTFTFPTGTR